MGPIAGPLALSPDQKRIQSYASRSEVEHETGTAEEKGRTSREEVNIGKIAHCNYVVPLWWRRQRKQQQRQQRQQEKQQSGDAEFTSSRSDSERGSACVR